MATVSFSFFYNFLLPNSKIPAQDGLECSPLQLVIWPCFPGKNMARTPKPLHPNASLSSYLTTARATQPFIFLHQKTNQKHGEPSVLLFISYAVNNMLSTRTSCCDVKVCFDLANKRNINESVFRIEYQYLLYHFRCFCFP